MQTSPLPSLNAGPGASPAPQAAPGTDGSQFGAALSREVDQRSAASQQTQQTQGGGEGAAKTQQQAHAPQQDAPAQQATQHPAAAARAANGKAAGGKDEDKDKDKDDADGSAAAGASAAAPATDMLAIVAGVAELLQRQGAIAPTAAPGAASSDGKAPVGATDSTHAGSGGPAAGVPADAAARFAALMRTGQGAQGATPAARAGADSVHGDAKGSTRGASLAYSTPAASLAPSSAPSAAPGAAPDTAPSAAPSPAPTAAAAALAAQLAAAVTHDNKPAAPDQAAAQILAAAQAQQAAPVMAQAQVLAADNHIPAQLGTPAWDNQVGQKIVWMVAGGEQSASLTLNPPDLGPMQVVLNVSGDQASVAFSSSHQDVRHALESALPRLREMMGESGIALGSATVSGGMPDQRQAQHNWQGTGSGSRGGGGAPVAAIDDGPVARAPARVTALGDRGMVDTFA